MGARVRGLQVYEASQRLAVPRERAFEFFTDARNLERITPPWLRFEVVTAGDVEMRPGALIDYRLTLRGLPLRWRTRIEVWEPPRRFVDIQLRGPYRIWEHTHEFEPDGDEAVVIRDRVRYALPFGPLGRIANAVIVRRDVERIFEHRRATIEELLLAATEPAAG